MSTHVAPSAATISPRSIPRRYVYTSVHDGLRCLQPMWVQCLGFTRQLSATYCAHLVLISNFSSPNMPFNFLHPFGFICRFPPRPLHNFLPLCCFNIRISPAPLCLSATSCMHLVSISRLPLSLNNFLRSSGFNI